VTVHVVLQAAAVEQEHREDRAQQQQHQARAQRQGDLGRGDLSADQDRGCATASLRTQPTQRTTHATEHHGSLCSPPRLECMDGLYNSAAGPESAPVLSWRPVLLERIWHAHRPDLPEIIAHRGNAAEFPENTLQGLESAVSLGVRYSSSTCS